MTMRSQLKRPPQTHALSSLSTQERARLRARLARITTLLHNPALSNRATIRLLNRAWWRTHFSLHTKTST